MKLYIIQIFLTSIVFAQSGHWQVIKTPVDLNLKYIHAIDSTNIWIGGDSSYILYTSDMGSNWTIQYFNPDFKINDIFFLDSSLGYAIESGTDGINVLNNILYTTNGGINWEAKRFRPDNVNIYSICFVSDSLGVIAGDGVFAITTNKGNDWNEVQRDSALFSFFPVRKIRFMNDSTAFAVGGSYDRGGVIWHSYDSGFTWVTDSAYIDPFLDLVFLNDSSILTLSSDIERSFPNAKFISNDLGNTWFYEEIPFYGVVSGIDKRLPSEIWATFQKEFLFSSDAGEHWETKSTPDSLQIFDIVFTDTLHGFAVAENGYFLKFIYEPVSVDEKIYEVSNDYILYQNFPNPFNPLTTIQIKIYTDSYLTLSVFNSSGEVIEKVFCGDLSSGLHEFQYDGSAIASGVYFYVFEILESKNFSSVKRATGKMILLK